MIEDHPRPPSNAVRHGLRRSPRASRVVAGFALLLGLLAAGPAAALTGSELLANCSEVLRQSDGASNVDPYKAGQCIGYLQGFGEGVKISALGASSNVQEYEKRRFYCLPEGVTNLQLVRGIVQALRALSHERLEEDAGVLVGLELRRAYPCKPGGNGSR